MNYLYVTVECAGTDEEHITAEFKTYGEACTFANMVNNCKSSRVDTVDIMLRLPDGSLTTEI